jgi:ABC-type dipeptide/oligopeptide/nickel transport system permease subunit
VRPVLGLIALAFALAFGLVYGAVSAFTSQEQPSW